MFVPLGQVRCAACNDGWKDADTTASHSPLACSVDIDECVSKPCQNGGTCLQSGEQGSVIIAGLYQCVCLVGYTGDDCENVPTSNPSGGSGGSTSISMGTTPLNPRSAWGVPAGTCLRHCYDITSCNFTISCIFAVFY